MLSINFQLIAAIFMSSLLLVGAAPTTEITNESSSSSTTMTPKAPSDTNATQTSQGPNEHGEHVKTSFTCYGRNGGYYADAELGCKVYHYCMAGDFNGELVYQRITYMCLNETLFDQKVTECVEPAKMSAPCHQEPPANPQQNATSSTTPTTTTSQAPTSTPAPTA